MQNHVLEKVDRTSFVPLYEQVKMALRKLIAINDLQAGSLLPTEQELCMHLGVSRITVVKALNDLAVEGVIERIQGKGTLVSAPKIHRSLKTVMGFSEAVRLQGLEVRSTLLSHKIVPGSSRVRATFGLRPAGQEEFIQFRRLRFIENRPVVLIKSVVSLDLGKELLKHDLEGASFYTLFEKINGRRVTRNDEILGKIEVGEEEARLLQVPVHSSHFLLYGASYLEGDIPVEVTEAIFHGDVFRFQINMTHLVPQLQMSSEVT